MSEISTKAVQAVYRLRNTSVGFHTVNIIKTEMSLMSQSEREDTLLLMTVAGIYSPNPAFWDELKRLAEEGNGE